MYGTLKLFKYSYIINTMILITATEGSAMNDSTIIIRISTFKKDKISKICEKKNTNRSKIIKELIDKFIMDEENEDRKNNNVEQ